MGRPQTWTDPEAFDKEVDEYFDSAEVPTWSGLALYLGFESRSSLQNYKERPEFLHSIKRALLRLEDLYEFRLNKARNPTGAIFALKNFGWRDKHEVDQRTEGKMEVLVKYEKRNSTSGTSSEPGESNQ